MMANISFFYICLICKFGLVYWGLTPQQQPGSYQGGEMMTMEWFNYYYGLICRPIGKILNMLFNIMCLTCC